MKPNNISEKTAINFIWAINYAKWGEKTLKKIIQNYELEKQGLQTEKLDIADIIPNHGENYDDWHGNVFYVQNIISWGMKFPENPVRVFTAFADSASLISFANEIRKFCDFNKDLEEYNQLSAKINKLEEEIKKFSYITSFIKNYIYKNKKKDIEDITNKITELKLDDSIKNTSEYKDYLDNQEFYDDFLKKVDELIPQKDFQENMINNHTFDHKKIKNLLIEFIQKKYKTDISLNKIKEEYQKTFKSFQEEFKKHNPNFEIIDFRGAVKNDEQAKQDLTEQNNNDLKAKAQVKALNLLLKDEIFEMINFVDSMKIFINYYGFGYEKNLTIDIDTTPLVFCNENDIEKFEKEIENANLIINYKKYNKYKEEIFLKDDVIYFGSHDPSQMILENQVCYTESLHLQNLQKIFFFCISRLSSNQDKIYRAIQNLFKSIKSDKKIIDIIPHSTRMYNSLGISGISDYTETPMNQRSSAIIEKPYEFEINWIQDGLKYDINDPDLDIKLDDVQFIQGTFGEEYKEFLGIY